VAEHAHRDARVPSRDELGQPAEHDADVEHARGERGLEGCAGGVGEDQRAVGLLDDEGVVRMVEGDENPPAAGEIDDLGGAERHQVPQTGRHEDHSADAVAHRRAAAGVGVDPEASRRGAERLLDDGLDGRGQVVRLRAAVRIAGRVPDADREGPRSAGRGIGARRIGQEPRVHPDREAARRWGERELQPGVGGHADPCAVRSAVEGSSRGAGGRDEEEGAGERPDEPTRRPTACS
jgi:hypothetical protein